MTRQSAGEEFQMTFTLAAYQRSIATGAGTIELQAITDAVLTTNPATSRLYASSEAKIIAAYAGGASLQRARVSTPWSTPNNLRPINSTSVGIPAGTNYPPVAEWLQLPQEIPPQQDIILDVLHTNGATQTVVGLLWLTLDGLEPRPEGETLTIRGDVTGAAPTALAWSEVTVAWEYALPPGRYAIVGSECISPTGIAHRWIADTTNFRPGAMSVPGLTTNPHPYQRSGELGVWSRFTAPVMPRLEVLCSAADAAHTVFLQLVRI